MRLAPKLLRYSLCISGALLLLTGAMARPAAPAPKHLAQAEALVENLRGASENVYGGGKRHIVWTPGRGAARTVCSSFVTLLLEHTYGWNDGGFRSWMGLGNPEAEDYHDAIAARNGFLRIVHVNALKAGDFLAIKYTDGHTSANGVEDTGHVMLVCAPPTAISPMAPVVAGTTQYTVTVIDSSASGHGPLDTRYQPGRGLTGGIGQGTFRIYANADGRIAGYTWSATPKSPFYSSPDRDLVAGRLLKDKNVSRL